MKRKPIEKNFVGCGCSIVYEMLEKNHMMDSCKLNTYCLCIDDIYKDIHNTTVEQLLEKYKAEIKNAELVEIIHITPLHDEVYELNKEDYMFYLVEQGMGYA